MPEFVAKKVAVLLNSGGLDCFLAAEKYASKGWELHSLYVPLSKLSNRAQERAARKTAKLFCKTHKVTKKVDNWICGLGSGQKTVAYPHTLTYAHFMGAMYAAHLGIDFILTGLRPEDVRSNFLDELSDLMGASSMTPKPLFVDPYMHPEMYDVEEDAATTHLDLGHTHSCFNNKPCGVCSKCKRRERLGIVKTPWYKFW